MDSKSDSLCKSLERDGYGIVREVLSPYECDEIEHAIIKESRNLPHMAHSDVVWNIRCMPKIRNIFEKLWTEKDLIVGFDGIFRRERGQSDKGLPWHIDQDETHYDGPCCYQAILVIRGSNLSSGNIVVLPGSHRRHRALSQRLGDGSRGWEFIQIPEDDILFKLCLSEYSPDLYRGDIFLWDSRTAHRVSSPLDINTDRTVVYLCMTPRYFADSETLALRKKAYKNGTSTTHWPHRFVNRGEAPAKGQDINDARRMELV